jgi:hypothetical protein
MGAIDPAEHGDATRQDHRIECTSLEFRDSDSRLRKVLTFVRQRTRPNFVPTA